MNFLNEIKSFFFELREKKRVIVELTKRDFKKDYVNSYLGFLWVIIEPLVFVSIYYFVFTHGLRIAPLENNVPFISFFITGLIPWMYFSSTLSSSTNLIKQYSFLVKKVNFRLSILPIVKLFSNIIIHLFFIFITILVVIYGGKEINLYFIQVLYYFFALTCFLFGLIFFVSALNLFLPDLGKFVSMLLQMGFWLTPIIWMIDIVPIEYRWIIKLNPLEYIVTGYRNSLLYDIPFYVNINQGIYFWLLSIFFLILGLLIFRKLRPHFAEVV